MPKFRESWSSGDYPRGIHIASREFCTRTNVQCYTKHYSVIPLQTKCDKMILFTCLFQRFTEEITVFKIR